MATIDITRAHALGKDEAKKRATEALEDLKREYGIQGTWNGYVFNINKPATGTFTIEEARLVVAVDLPFLMRPLKGTIENKIHQTLDAKMK